MIKKIILSLATLALLTTSVFAQEAWLRRSIAAGGVINGQLIVDHTDPEAFLVRRDGDSGDIFIVDTTNSNVNLPDDIPLYFGTDLDWSFKYDEITSNSLVFSEGVIGALSFQGAAITNFTAAADTSGNDIWIGTQTGGTDAGANPDGGDYIMQPGIAGSGGSGRRGIVTVNRHLHVGTSTGDFSTGNIKIGGNHTIDDGTALKIDRNYNSSSQVAAIGGEVLQAGTGDVLGTSFTARANHSSGTITNLIAHRTGVRVTGAGDVTNAIGYNALSPTEESTGEITNAYGIKVEDHTVGTNNWAIFTGLGTVHLGDLTEIEVSGNPLTVQNTTDAVSNQVGIFRSGNRATALDNDNGYFSFTSDNDAGAQIEIARLGWAASDVSAAAEKGRITISALDGSGSMQELMRAGYAPAGAFITINSQTNNTTFNMEGDTGANLFTFDPDANSSEGSIAFGNAAIGDLDITDAIGMTFTGPTLTSSTTNDYGIQILHTLNDGTGGGSDEYALIRGMLTRTDADAWEDDYLMLLGSDGNNFFRIFGGNGHVEIGMIGFNSADQSALKITMNLGADVDGTEALELNVSGLPAGGTSDNTVAGLIINLNGAAGDTDMEYDGIEINSFQAGGGAGFAVANRSGSNFDIFLEAESGTWDCFEYSCTFQTVNESDANGPSIFFVAADGGLTDRDGGGFDFTLGEPTGSGQQGQFFITRESDGTDGPDFILFLDSTDPDSGDATAITYRFNNSVGTETDFAFLDVEIVDPTDGSEESIFSVEVLQGAGVETQYLRADGTDGITSVVLSRALQNKQGADLASATNLTLGKDGNVFELTGTTKVDLISNVGWQEGSEICLIANENVTLDDGTATSGTDITLALAGGADFSMTAEDMWCAVLSSITATGQAWREKTRSAN